MGRRKSNNHKKINSTPTQTMDNEMSTSDVIIIGGGLAGQIAAYAIAKTGLQTIHLAPKAPVDRRTSALMTPSVKILQELNLIDTPSELGIPLEKIRIIDATSRLVRAPEALFDSKEAGETAFGWNFSNAELTKHFVPKTKELDNLKRIEASAKYMRRSEGIWTIDLSDGSTVRAPLIVGADGKKSFVRQSMGIGTNQRDHKQSALVCDLTLERPLNGESVEYHYDNGPFTLVPAGDNKANLVWVENADILAKVKEKSPQDIRKTIQEKSNNLFGHINLDTGIFVFPLSTFEANKLGDDGVVLLGEAGHAFPPIGAQGLNLSLRDVKDLISCLNECSIHSSLSPEDWANDISLNYAKKRHSDIKRTKTMVDTLFSSLLSELLPAQALRTGGIWALKSIAPLRKYAFQLGMGPS